MKGFLLKPMAIYMAANAIQKAEILDIKLNYIQVLYNEHLKLLTESNGGQLYNTRHNLVM